MPSHEEVADVQHLLKSKEEYNEKKLGAMHLQIAQLQDDIFELVKLCNEKEASIIAVRD